MPEQTYSTSQAAEKLGLSLRRVQALVSTGLLKANKTGRDWAIPEDEVERFKQKERLAGRPGKKTIETGRDFVDKPSDIYQQVVEIIKILIEHEGLDTTYRAFAEAAWRRIQTEVTVGLKPKGLAHVCLYRLLGRKRCPDTLENPCDAPQIPGSDHVSEWTQNGTTVKVISQPYHMSYETMKEMVEFCEKNGLRADISSESWHFPGKTIRVDITLNNEVNTTKFTGKHQL